MPQADYSKLLGRIKEKGFTQKSLSREICISESHFARKLKGEFSFTQKEIFDMCTFLDIDATKIGEYFFCEKS